MKDQIFDRLFVKNRAENNKHGQTMWECRCICGNTVIVLGNDLKRGHTRSCGCYKRERAVELHSRPLSIKTRKKMSGKNHHNWKGGITSQRKKDYNSLEHKNWRQNVYEKNNYTCQKCGEGKGGNLNAHHIESYNNNPELRIEPSNGITFCEDCHTKFHKKYGYGNNTKTQLIKFLKET